MWNVIYLIKLALTVSKENVFCISKLIIITTVFMTILFGLSKYVASLGSI